MSAPPSDNTPSIDPELLRKLSRLMRKAKRAHGLAHAATILRAAIAEARDERHDIKDEAAQGAASVKDSEQR